MAQKGRKPIKLSRVKFLDSIPYLDIEAIEKGIILQYADPYSSVHASKTDLFIVWDGARSGLVAKGLDGAVGSTLVCLKPLLVNATYLYYFLKSKYEYLNKNTTGSSIPHINAKLFYSLDIPIPPLKEQEKIVLDLEARLNEYRYDFEMAENELTKIEESQKAIIEQAVTGRLTQKWRQEHKILNSKQSFGNHLIPRSWIKTKLEDISESISDGDHQAPKRVAKGIPFVLISNISKGKINFENTSFVSKAYYNGLKDFRKPQIGDLLYTIVGSIGSVVLITNKLEFCFQRHIALIRPNKKCISKYLYYLLLSNIVYNQAIEKSKGIAQQTLNLSDLRTIDIILPPINEQKVIISNIEKLLEDLYELEANYIKNKSSVQQLFDAVVQMAFTGELSSKYDYKEDFTDYFSKLENEKLRIEKELKGFKEKQSLSLKKYFMNSKDIDSIKEKIKELALKKYGKDSTLSDKDIDVIRDNIQSSVKDFDYDDFSKLFIELVQDKIEPKDKSPFFIAVNTNGKLSFKINSDETSTSSTL